MLERVRTHLLAILVAQPLECAREMQRLLGPLVQSILTNAHGNFVDRSAMPSPRIELRGTTVTAIYRRYKYCICLYAFEIPWMYSTTDMGAVE